MDRDRTSSRSDTTQQRSGAELGAADKRPDGPDQGVAKSGVKP